ncbi:MAG: hypothetical protein FP814_10220 [Desulfobacterium sp.]|nr:hypothetical protein [Desulfobacterium sp.]MBU3947564.1 hypothetical protein [Pseudomonadota bacterium]MBU4011233.1 hypothetical protein [Pseudomonadota bacterium]
MDKELILQQFDEIENRLEKLVAVCKSHEASNLELKNKILVLEEELQEKIEKENSYIQERDIVKSKIDSLLSRLSDIT